MQKLRISKKLSAATKINDSVNFKNCMLMNSNVSPPFTFEPDSVTEWLVKTSASETTQASEQLYKALKFINKGSLQAEPLYPILEKLTPEVLHHANCLEALFSKTDTDLSAKTRKVAKLSIQLLRQLGLAYNHLASYNQFAPQQQTLIIKRALQVIALAMRQSALIHERPSETLWKLIGDLYLQAKYNNILQIEAREKIQVLKKQATIDAVIKQNLLFAMCSPYRFSSEEIDAVYAFSESHCQLLKMSTQANELTAANFYWDYESRVSPQSVYYGALIKSKLLLDTHDLCEYLNSKKFSGPLSKETSQYILATLSNYRTVINSTTPGTPKIYQLIIGFQQIVDFMENPQQYAGCNDFELEPLAERGFNRSSEKSGKIWQQSNSSAFVNTVKVHSTLDAGLDVAELQTMPNDLGEPAVVFTGKEQPVLCVIRQIQKNAQVNIWRILLEKLSGEVSYVQLSGKSKSKATAILVRAGDAQREILLPVDKYSTGSGIRIVQHGQQFEDLTLARLVDFTPHYMRYQVA